MPTTVKRTVQSVDRAVEILDMLSESTGGLRLGELARRTGLAAQTAQSLLRTLEAHGLAVQAGRGEPYALGPRVLEWSSRWRQQRDPAGEAREACRKLAGTLNEYVALAELRGDSVAGLIEVQPDRTLSVRSDFASAGRLHTMATAKVLLAWADADRRDAAIAGMTFQSFGPRSARSADAYRRQLAAVRRRGYALCLEEASAGIAALAVPVRNAIGEVVAALGIAAPLIRLGPARRKEALVTLRAAAHDVAQAWA